MTAKEIAKQIKRLMEGYIVRLTREGKRKEALKVLDDEIKRFGK